MQRQQQQQREGFDWVQAQKTNVNIVAGLLGVYQRAIVVPMRHRFGVEALGLAAVLAFSFMVVWAACWKDPLMWGYLAYWTLCVLLRRSEAKRLVRKGEKIHSLSGGWPREAMRIPFVRTPETAMLIVEPLLVFGLGVGCWFAARHWHTPPGLAIFLMVGALVLNVVEWMRQKIAGRRAQAILDARMEQEAVMQEFRSKWGNS